MTWLRLLTGFLIYSVVYSEKSDGGECKLKDDLVNEIHSHKGLVDKIIQEVTNGSYKGKFYDDLYDFIEKFGYRMTGTENLNNAIKYLSDTLTKKDLVVKLEDFKIPPWARGKEIAFYITPLRKKRLRIKALGNSASGNIVAPLMVVKDIKELEARKNETPGKIVLFNYEFKDYLTDVAILGFGPAKASTFEAVGALVRSITPFSIGNIHLGNTNFNNLKPIPAAAISLEDADLLARIVKKEKVTIELMITLSEGSVSDVSQNLIADIPGKSESNTYFSVTGHIDSWDVGQGALDNAGGSFLAIHSLLLLKHMKIEPPRRTLRSILWTGAEIGLKGVHAYVNAHPHEFENTTAVFEAEMGLYEPLGFKTVANQEGYCILKEIASLFDKLNTTRVEKLPINFGDLALLKPLKVPLMQPLLKANNFEWFRHTEGDSMRQMNSDLMDKHLALISGTGYILANLKTLLPRRED